MIEPIEERIQKRLYDCEKYIKAEYTSQLWINKLSNTLPEHAPSFTQSLHPNATFIDIVTNSIYDAELIIVPTISDILHTKWSKEIGKENIIWSTVPATLDNFQLYISVSYVLTEKCLIQKIPTGKIVKEWKLVNTAEYEYVTDCSMGDE